jgi:hypothetical protein
VRAGGAAALARYLIEVRHQQQGLSRRWHCRCVSSVGLVWFAEDLSGGHDAHFRAGQRWHGGDQVSDAIGLAGNEFVELGALPDRLGAAPSASG